MQAICSASVSYLFILLFCDDSCQTCYLKIYQTDLCQIVTVGRSVAVDDQSEISFSVPQGILPWQVISVGCIHRTDFFYLAIG